MKNGDKQELVVRLTLAKLEIIKLKVRDQGYDWAMCGDKGRAQIEQCLSEINALLTALENPES